MPSPRVRIAVLALIGIGLGVGTGAAGAADPYPAKPIKLIVPSAPAGPMDILARLIGAKLYEAWGQPVVVESKPGAGAIVGLAYVAPAPADRYTLSMFDLGSPIHVRLPAKLPFDLLRDLPP